MRARVAALGMLAMLAGCAAAPPPASPVRVHLVPVVTQDLTHPLLVLEDPLHAGRLLIAQQNGLVRALSNGSLEDAPFLDIRDRTTDRGERGLLGLAFSPHHAQDGIVIVSYTDLNGDSVVARYHRVGDSLDHASEAPFLHVAQPYANHNGGNVVFGPDGMLYVGLGDGGSEGDPQGNGQNFQTLLASLLRLDVSGAAGYQIPDDDPYAHGGVGRPELWAKGLRNPWRFSFDRETGDLWIGDVGGNAWEEIDLQPHTSRGGENYGWNVWEGAHPHGLPRATTTPATPPVAEYSHAEGCSVVGGYVYRGAGVPALRGAYVFGDYCSGNVWTLTRASGAGAWTRALLLDTHLAIDSFGEDAAGEVYVVDHNGGVYRLAPE